MFCSYSLLPGRAEDLREVFDKTRFCIRSRIQSKQLSQNLFEKLVLCFHIFEKAAYQGGSVACVIVVCDKSDVAVGMFGLDFAQHTVGRIIVQVKVLQLIPAHSAISFTVIFSYGSRDGQYHQDGNKQT